MTFHNRLTRILGIKHPILLAPMDVVSGGRLAAAVSNAGGLGLLGGGYGDEDWIARTSARRQRSHRLRLYYMELGQARRVVGRCSCPPARSRHALVRRSTSIRADHTGCWRAADLSGADHGAGA